MKLHRTKAVYRYEKRCHNESILFSKLHSMVYVSVKNVQLGKKSLHS